jgi:hypothetical protein
MMGPNHETPNRISTETTLAGVLVRLIEDRVTEQASGTVIAHTGEKAEGPALWRTIRRQRAAAGRR